MMIKTFEGNNLVCRQSNLRIWNLRNRDPTTVYTFNSHPYLKLRYKIKALCLVLQNSYYSFSCLSLVRPCCYLHGTSPLHGNS